MGNYKKPSEESRKESSPRKSCGRDSKSSKHSFSGGIKGGSDLKHTKGAKPSPPPTLIRKK